MMAENKKKQYFTKTSLKIKFSKFITNRFFSIQKLLNEKNAKEKFNPIILGWNNNLKSKTLQIESECFKTKGLTYAQISPIK